MRMLSGTRNRLIIVDLRNSRTLAFELNSIVLSRKIINDILTYSGPHNSPRLVFRTRIQKSAECSDKYQKSEIKTKI